MTLLSEFYAFIIGHCACNCDLVISNITSFIRVTKVKA